MRLTAEVTSAAARRGGFLLLAGLTGAALLLSGCGAGQNSQTARKTSVVPGARADLGPIALRNVQIAYGGRDHRSYDKGENAPLDVRIFNTGATADKLVKVSSDAATSVLLVGSEGNDPEICTAAKVKLPAAEPAPSESASAPSESPSASPSESAAPAASEPAGSAEFTIDLGPDSCALLVADQPYHLELSGLRQEISPGASVPVTFTFAEAGEVTLKVPLGNPTEGADNEPVPMKPEEPTVVGGGE